MGKNSKLGVIVYPRDKDFQIIAGSTVMGSRQYASSSNAYRGARLASRNLLKNRNVSNDTNYGSNVCAVVNNNNYVIAATDQFAKTNSATSAVKKVLEVSKGIKKLPLQVAK